MSVLYPGGPWGSPAADLVVTLLGAKGEAQAVKASQVSADSVQLVWEANQILFVPVRAQLVNKATGKSLLVKYAAPPVMIERRATVNGAVLTNGGNSCQRATDIALALVNAPVGATGEVEGVAGDWVDVVYSLPDGAPEPELALSCNQHSFVASLEQPSVSFQFQNQETVGQEFGKRIEDKFLVAHLTVRNPEMQAVQFRKSAVVFHGQCANEEAVKSASREIALENRKSDGKAIPEKFEPTECDLRGLPLEEIQGSFDGDTAKQDSYLEIMTGAASSATALAVVESGSKHAIINGLSFVPIMGMVTGNIFPVVKSVVADDEHRKRLRDQLFAADSSEIIQVPAQSSIQTDVFLPRKVALVGTSAYACSGKECGAPWLVWALSGVALDFSVVSQVEQHVTGSPGSLQ